FGNDGFGAVFRFHQDVAGAVFLASVGGSEFVVFGLDLSVRYRIFLLVVRKQFADQNGLARQIHLLLVLFGGVQATLAGFLQEDFARNDFFLDLGIHFGRYWTARAFDLLLERGGTL